MAIEMDGIKVGDLITFKLTSGRDSSYMRKSTRRVTEVYPKHDRVAVTRFVGYKDFIVRAHEILAVAS